MFAHMVWPVQLGKGTLSLVQLSSQKFNARTVARLAVDKWVAKLCKFELFAKVLDVHYGVPHGRRAPAYLCTSLPCYTYTEMRCIQNQTSVIELLDKTGLRPVRLTGSVCRLFALESQGFWLDNDHLQLSL